MKNTDEMSTKVRNKKDGMEGSGLALTKVLFAYFFRELIPHLVKLVK